MTQQLDLVDEMQWEDVVEFDTLQDSGLEEPHSQPIFGGTNPLSNGIYAYTSWFYDGDDSAFGVI
jgi:hypothetical protein